MGDEIGDINGGGTKMTGVYWGEEFTFSVVFSSLTIFSEEMKFLAPDSEGSSFSIFCKVQMEHLKM